GAAALVLAEHAGTGRFRVVRKKREREYWLALLLRERTRGQRGGDLFGQLGHELLARRGRLEAKRWFGRLGAKEQGSGENESHGAPRQGLRATMSDGGRIT